MNWEIIIVLVIAVPVILFPAAFVWYLNGEGVIKAIRETRAKKLARQKEFC